MSTFAPPRPRLSICLPTHHGRAEALDRALRSIAAQQPSLPTDALEVCVSDNGSADATQAVLAAHRLTFGASLVTFRFHENQGFTANLLKAVDLARGEFCWLMGSDDEVEPGGIATVLAKLAASPEVSGLTLNRRNVDDARPDEVHLDDPRILPPDGRDVYSDAEQVFAELAMLQDYISTQVVRRDCWEAAVRHLGPDGIAAGLNFPHLPILAAIIRQDPRWRWVAEPIIRHRVGLESVRDTFVGGPTRYTIIVTSDRALIWHSMFGPRSRLYRLAMSKIWLVQANPHALVNLKRQPDQTLALDARLLACIARYYWFVPSFWTLSLPVLLLPHQLLTPALWMVRRLRTRCA